MKDSKNTLKDTSIPNLPEGFKEPSMEDLQKKLAEKKNPPKIFLEVTGKVYYQIDNETKDTMVAVLVSNEDTQINIEKLQGIKMKIISASAEKLNIPLEEFYEKNFKEVFIINVMPLGVFTVEEFTKKTEEISN